MSVKMLSQNGEEVKKQVKLDNSVFGVEINNALIRQALHVYQNNQRQANANTKTRGDVRGGGAKPWKQKGTGRARQGSTRSPIWAGGGVAFGPKSNRNYKRKLSKKMVKGAIRSAFSLAAKEDRLLIMENPELKAERLTNQVEAIIKKLPVAGKLLIVHKGDNNNLYLGGKNISGLRILPVNQINTYELVKNDFVVLTDDSLKTISEFWGKSENSETEEKTEVKKVEVKEVAKKAVPKTAKKAVVKNEKSPKAKQTNLKKTK